MRSSWTGILSPWRLACWAFLVVCVCGFGIMTSLWYLLPHNSEIPGHWSYAAGTVGDAVVLPVIAGALTYMVAALPACRTDRKAAAIGAVLGAAGGATVQYSWIADANPRLNWVLPRPGTFSIPGWYHAIFLVAVSTTICSAYLVLVMRLRSASADTVRRIRWPMGIFSTAVPLFLSLVILDSAPSNNTSSSMTTIVMCGLGILASLLPLSLATRHIRQIVPVQIAGVMVGTVLIKVVLTLWHH